MVSIPSRYLKDKDEKEKFVCLALFQFLLGTLRMRSTSHPKRARHDVSIPSRYLKDGIACAAAAGASIVSIPSRYLKDTKF